MDDERLERAMREGLRHKADEVEIGCGYAVAAHRGARRRGRVKVAAAGVLAAAVIVPVAVIAQQGPDRTADLATGDRASSDAPAPVVPADWRVESYAGVQLRVPPDWGWGGVPFHDVQLGDDITTCGDGPFALPSQDGTTKLKAETKLKADEDLPYVGRSRYAMSDVCTGGLPDVTAPWVWFGSPVDVDIGTISRGNGYVQTTLDVAGVRVTVGDDDPEELATILGSIEAVDVDANGCQADVETVPQPSPADRDPFLDLGTVTSVSVCAYRRAFEDNRRVLLGYSSELGRERAQEAVDAIARTPRVLPRGCSEPTQWEDTVVLRIHTADKEIVLVADLVCGAYLDFFSQRGFTRANVEPWVVDGVGLYVSGGVLGYAPLSDLFHPIPG